MRTKYKIGDMVYSYQNKEQKCPINFIRPSEDERYQHKYRLTLPNGNSNWIDEQSIFKFKLTKL